MIAIEYPSIEIDGRKLTVKDSFAAQLLMTRRGLVPHRLNEYVGPGKPESASNWMKIFSCMVAENFASQEPARYDLDSAPTGDYWATRLEENGLNTQSICDVCNAAMVKAEEARKSKLAAVPPLAQAS